MFNEYKNKWLENINSNISISKNKGENKLRTCKLFKRTYETEQYVKNHIISRTKRSAIAKFRCGVAPPSPLPPPFHVETGRYVVLSVDKRYCFHFKSKIENEEHVLIECPLYCEIRHELFSMTEILVTGFQNLSNSDKVCHLLSDSRIVNYSAKACHDILMERRKHVYI